MTNIPWSITAEALDDRIVKITLENKGFYFSGNLNLDIHLGPNVRIEKIYTKSRVIGSFRPYQRLIKLYSPELEQYSTLAPKLAAVNACFHILEEKYQFPKKLFHKDGRYFVLRIIDIWNILTKKDKKVFQTAFPIFKFYEIEYDTREYILFKLDQNEYEQLPKLCTVQDIRTITSAYIDEVHTFYNKFWYEITQHSLNDKPIALLTDYNELIISELTKYNMWVVRKLPKSTNYLLSNN